MLFNAENRIYYAIYYIVSALAIKNDYSTSKHSQLLSAVVGVPKSLRDEIQII